MIKGKNGTREWAHSGTALSGAPCNRGAVRARCGQVVNAPTHLFIGEAFVH